MPHQRRTPTAVVTAGHVTNPQFQQPCQWSSGRPLKLYAASTFHWNIYLYFLLYRLDRHHALVLLLLQLARVKVSVVCRVFTGKLVTNSRIHPHRSRSRDIPSWNKSIQADSCGKYLELWQEILTKLKKPFFVINLTGQKCSWGSCQSVFGTTDS